MSAFTYTALRSVVTGHTENAEYVIGVRCATRELDPDTLKTGSTALSGKTETLLWRHLRSWSIVTGAVAEGELDLMQEFVDSISGGETFEFDEFGDAQSTPGGITVVMDGKYKRRRHAMHGDGGERDHFRFSFVIREVPG